MHNNDTITATDIAIVGAGPIGIELAVSLKQLGVDYLHFDAQQIGYTMSWWPRDTTFFSTTERIEIAGVPIQNTAQGRTTGEEYLAYLRSIVEQFDLRVNTYEPVTGIERTDGGFLLLTQPQTGPRRYRARNVVLASGDMHRPHRLGIPGEDLPHVDGYLREPHRYYGRKVLIIAFCMFAACAGGAIARQPTPQAQRLSSNACPIGSTPYVGLLPKASIKWPVRAEEAWPPPL
jgi:thioredoxin reductase (NADPH)